jgi:uncharacterized protein
MSATKPLTSLVNHVRRELPGLNDAQARELAEILSSLVATFQPDVIYAYGSRARNDASADSDVDLMVVISESAEPGYRRDQQAYRSIPLHRLPVDILVVTRSEFARRVAVPASLPATVLREGKTLYAA